MGLKEERGITLVEVLLALTIAAVIGGVVYGVLHQTIFAKEKSESHNELRQEANILMTKLRTMHESGKTLEFSKVGSNIILKEKDSVDGSQVYSLIENAKDNTKYQLKSFTVGDKVLNDFLQPDQEGYPFNSTESVAVEFELKDKQNNEYKLKSTLIGEKRKKEVSINGSYRFLVDKDVFLYSSTFDVGSTGKPSVYGIDASIVITGKNGLNLSGFTGNSKSIEVTSFYINGPLIRKSDDSKGNDNSKMGDIGTENPRGELYVNGDMILTTNGGNNINNIYGKVSVNGNVNIGGKFKVVDSLKYKLNNTSSNTTNMEWDPNIPPFEFNNFTTRKHEWYKVEGRGYTIHTAKTNKPEEVSIGNNGKVYIESRNITAKVSGDKILVVSEGDIEVNKGGSGVLFAPNGNVTFNTNNETFTGIIVAKNIYLNKTVLKSPTDIQQFFKDYSIGSDDEFPLIIAEPEPSN